MQEEKKTTAPNSPKHPGCRELNRRQGRKLGALAGKIWVSSGFDETPPEVIAAFEGK